MPNLPKSASKKPAAKKPSVQKSVAKPVARKTTTKSIPGYKVPKSLLKNTKSNENAGRPSLASVLAKQDKKIAKYNEAKKPKTPAKKTTTSKNSKDWQKGIDAEKAIARRNKQLQNVINQAGR